MQIHGWVCALCLQIRDYTRYLYSLCYLSAKYGRQWITNDFETINLIYVDITKKINSDDYPSYYSPSLDINLILWIHIFFISHNFGHMVEVSFWFVLFDLYAAT